MFKISGRLKMKGAKPIISNRHYDKGDSRKYYKEKSK